jgi:hypothetical protein
MVPSLSRVLASPTATASARLIATCGAGLAGGARAALHRARAQECDEEAARAAAPLAAGAVLADPRPGQLAGGGALLSATRTPAPAELMRRLSNPDAGLGAFLEPGPAGSSAHEVLSERFGSRLPSAFQSLTKYDLSESSCAAPKPIPHGRLVASDGEATAAREPSAIESG